MLKLNSVTFKDDETGKIMEVNVSDGCVAANQKFSPEEYVFCSYHAGLLVSGGIDKTKEFLKPVN